MFVVLLCISDWYHTISPFQKNGLLENILTKKGSVLEKEIQWVVLVGVYFYKYWWEDEIQSRKSSLSNKSMSLKACQTLKHCTAVYTVRQDFTICCNNCEVNITNNLPGICVCIYLNPHCITELTSFKWKKGLRTKVCLNTELKGSKQKLHLCIISCKIMVPIHQLHNTRGWTFDCLWPKGRNNIPY